MKNKRSFMQNALTIAIIFVSFKYPEIIYTIRMTLDSIKTNSNKNTNNLGRINSG